MKAIFAVCAVSLLLAKAAWAEGFEGSMKLREITVDNARLITMLGRDATDSKKVFAVPIERFLSLGGTDSGVNVENTELYVKGALLRAESTGKGFAAIVNTDSGLMTIINHKNKSYLQMTKAERNAVNTLKATPTAGPTHKDQAAATEIKALGQTKVVNDMKTSAYEVRTSNATVLAWISSEDREAQEVFKTIFSPNQALMVGSRPEDNEVVRKLAAQGLPMRLQRLDANGYRISDFLSVKKEHVAADLFAPPADFKKLGTPAGGSAN